MTLHDHFDVAHLLGHPAFEHLAAAMDVYSGAKRDGLFNPETHPWVECLAIGGQLHCLRKTELQQCVRSVILFQAMMEKVPSFVPSIGSGISSASRNGFANTWEDLLLQIHDPTTQTAASDAFNQYNNSMYRRFRNPIIHGRQASDIAAINDIRVPHVHEGMRQGWLAYDYLLAEAFAPDQAHQPSWAVMCNAHRIPATLDSDDYPDLNSLAGDFNSRHLDGARASSDG